MMISIDKVSNGYIVSLPMGEKQIFVTLDEVMMALLHYFEGRSPDYSSEAYGVVWIQRERPPVTMVHGVSGIQLSVQERPLLEIVE